MKICRVAEMRDLDGGADEKYGIEALLLMENAGAGTASVISRELDGVKEKNILVLCGGGNNGGDGFVVARHLLSAGAAPRIVIASDPSKYRGAARKNYDIIRSLPLELMYLDDIGSRRLNTLFRDADAIVDAILGTGLDREVRGVYADLINRVNTAGKPVVCVDIPSGINGDTGQVMGTAVRGDCTVTFGLPKIGNILHPGCETGGRLFVNHISFPREHYEQDTIGIELNEPPSLPLRNPAGHKGDFGDALFIAGAASYYGAPSLSAGAFLRAGGGYARLAAPRSMIPTLAQLGSEIVFVPQDETPSGSIAASNVDALVGLSGEVDFVVLGPGLSRDGETQGLAVELARRIEKPLLVDGDGITALCDDLNVLRKRKAATVLTPHPGEMARITGRSVRAIEEDRVSCLRETAVDLNAVIVLKGARSLVGYPDGRIRVNMSGNSGMATAGSGDVLTGIIAAMYGLGLPFDDAVAKGVFMHGLAGDIAAEETGEDGITAVDILEYLPEALREERLDIGGDLFRRYRPEIVR
ncbi:MAG TPA: NAD(P)H-hydrate dehydratase [Deltaproteobacteria bacterium]|nr:NAD(P)H-hydrate dehydratase [Deltaproteobacteria bacterium]